MAICAGCGKKLGLLEGSSDGLCSRCRVSQTVEQLERNAAPEERQKIQEHKAQAEEIESVLLTTETHPDLNIVERKEIVTAECAFGMNIFKDLFAGVRDIVGGRSEAVQKTMRDTRKVALYELKKEAHSVGANAVVGVDLDYTELSAAGNMVLLVASGTAVVVENLK